ncbi:MFS transporter [Jannaschia helgolandensis]|uniref:MFS transporter n=1 Tax=Jannaschia helgolandensis TaxID=188906 RepID=UPI0030DDCFC8|tara:strand:- start:9353 stop:10492 length:1140 start_codon:yes stop_codon:yes gene_type:complete
MNATLRLGATGFALIAICYGLARFAFGLFLPEVRADLGLTPSFAGAIAGGSFLGYCLAIVASAALVERYGPRPVAMGAGIVAASGMALIAVAQSSATLAVAVLFAGTSTGLASPPLAAAVALSVQRQRQNAVNTVINSGTSAGVALSGPVALYLGADWRLAYGAFAMAAALVTTAILWTVPKTRANASHVARGLPRFSADLVTLVTAAFLMGAASTAVWSFGGELVSRNLGWESRAIGALWIVIGASGIAGAMAGALCARFGVNAVQLASLLGLAVGIGLIGTSITTPVLVMTGGALFGAAYILLTGVYLVWGVSALPDRPASGLTVAFLAIAIGQTAGAPIFGSVLEAFGAGGAATLFAGIALSAGIARRRPLSVATS